MTRDTEIITLKASAEYWRNKARGLEKQVAHMADDIIAEKRQRQLAEDVLASERQIFNSWKLERRRA